MRSLCLVVPRNEGEKVRKILSESGNLNTKCRLRVEDDVILLPVKEEVDLGYVVREEEFEQRGPRYKNYKEAVEGVPDGLLGHLPTSFDTIGDIAIIKIPDELVRYRANVGDAILRAFPSIRVAAMDKGVTGTERRRDLEPIAGEGGLETVHREHGLRFEVDVSRCYFSPRLATERARIADLVKDGERVLDMFAGVGPFSILIAKRAKVERLWAVDINPVAVGYLEQNIEINKVMGVEAVHADSMEFVRDLPPLDRIIMNLPHSGHEFLPGAVMACANDATIHYYEILEEPGERKAWILALEGRTGKGIEISDMRAVRSFSPTEDHYAYDIKVYSRTACATADKGPRDPST